jgi:hypothetical protein
MAEDKIEAIKKWQASRSRRDIESYLSLENFFPTFIKDFSQICLPLTESRKGQNTDWR